jgi:hypothetical protein
MTPNQYHRYILKRIDKYKTILVIYCALYEKNEYAYLSYRLTKKIKDPLLRKKLLQIRQALKMPKKIDVCACFNILSTFYYKNNNWDEIRTGY